MRKGSLVAAAVTAVLLVAVAPAAAQTAPAGCGGEWTESAECTFPYEGGGLSVVGSFRADFFGNVTVTIETDTDAGVPVPVLACTPGPGGFGVCGTYSDGSMTLDLEKGQTLYCKVEGADSGSYDCANFSFDSW